LWGCCLGIPADASARVAIAAIFKWYQKVSGLYEADFEQEGEISEQE